LGAAAQAQAFQDFQASPGQAFLQSEGERAILRNAAAIGGLGGGNLQRELARYGQGLSLQDLERQTQQLSDVAGRGFAAAGTGADIVSRLRGQQAGLGAQLAQAPPNPCLAPVNIPPARPPASPRPPTPCPSTLLMSVKVPPAIPNPCC